MGRVGQQRRVQVGQGFGEAVVELQQLGAQHTHGSGRRRQVPPRRERRLGVTDVARVALGRDRIEVALGQAHGTVDVVGLLPPGQAQGVQFLRLRIGGARGQAFEHLLVGRG